jgi:hypothetical protein
MTEEKQKSPAEILLAQYKQQGMVTFGYTWQGETRYPEKIKFPEGIEKKVSQMGDSIIVFEDTTKALYERDSDNPRKIKVGYLPNVKIPLTSEQPTRIPPKVRPILKEQLQPPQIIQPTSTIRKYSIENVGEE